MSITPSRRYHDILCKVDHSWTLFLDRDGTINVRRENDYVKTWREFSFLPDVLDGLALCRSIFGRICIVTNQQGVGKGVMSQEDLEGVHSEMLTVMSNYGIFIDQVYTCTQKAEVFDNCRKPNPAMALQAATDFPEIRFSKSIMIGDMPVDIEFGHGLNMTTVFIGSEKDLALCSPHCVFQSVGEFAQELIRAIDLK